MKRMISLVMCVFPLFTACDAIDALGGGDASECDTPIIDVFDTPSCCTLDIKFTFCRMYLCSLIALF